MKHQAFGVGRMLEDADAGQFQRHIVNIADNHHRIANFDAILVGDLLSDCAAGSQMLECRHLIRGHVPILADVENHIRIDSEPREEVFGLFVYTRKPAPRRDKLDARNGLYSLIVAGREGLCQ